MDASTIFLIIHLLIFFLLISCLIVGDTYLTYMIFNASAYTCESFYNIPVAPPPPPPPPAITFSTTISQYSSCYKLSDAQVGFARFKIIMFWVLFLCVTGALIYRLAKLYPRNQILFGIIIAITLIMSIFIIVGGAFMTQYGFLGDNKTCIMPTANASAPQIKSSEYCYNLNQTELNFAKIAVVFGWMYSFAAIITIGLFIWEKNFG